MARNLLLVLLILLLGIAALGTLQRALLSRGQARHTVAQRPAPPVATGDITLRSRVPLVASRGRAPTLDSLTRSSVRLQLGAEPTRHYLDSLPGETDSIVRHWVTADSVLPMTIVPGGSVDFVPEMVPEVRDAFDAWHPGAVGVRFVEQRDTAAARLLIRWVDTLEANRAGATDLTWDHSGRIYRAVVTLATRSPSTGRPFSPAIRRTIAMHELGHALGLPHSRDRADVMHPVATAPELTDRDRFSLRLLYELPTGWIGTRDSVSP